MTKNQALADWVASPMPYDPPHFDKPWITTAECVHRFNALYSGFYPRAMEAIPLADYLANADDAERKRVMEIVNWQPPT